MYRWGTRADRYEQVLLHLADIGSRPERRPPHPALHRRTRIRACIPIDQYRLASPNEEPNTLVYMETDYAIAGGEQPGVRERLRAGIWPRQRGGLRVLRHCGLP